MAIRKVNIKDMSQFLILREQNLIEFGYKKVLKLKLKKEFLDGIKSKNTIILVAEENKILKGYISITLIKNIWQRLCYIDDIFVKKDSRRKGIGLSLLKELIKIMKSRKIKKFKLGVETKNEKAIQLYKKIGFKTTHYEMEMKI